MTDISRLLFELTEDERVFDPDYDLIESGALDSLAFIELFSRLEDEGIELQPTRIDRSELRTPASIARLIESRR
ncbi:MAG: phosphopantetheine-binding protein [Oscillospiraceae bacterium]|nr:phosphopantetheine-binding protein [Oscillospiraceae bacterium]